MSLAKGTRDGKPDVPFERVSERLRRHIAEHPREWMSLNDLMGGIGGPRAFGVLLLLLALPNSIPIPSLPGVSTVFGLPLALFAAQVFLGHARPWLPAFLGNKTLRREDLLKFIDRGQPYLVKLEAYLQPRASWFVSPIAERLAGLIMLVMAIILALPIVFGNFLPGFAILLMALALLARDGRMMIAGWIASFLAVVLVGFVIFVGIEAIKLAFDSIIY